jgi:hypothetical protein
VNWVTNEQCISLLKFLEISPPIRKGLLKIDHLSFYSSELKNLKQILELLSQTSNVGWDNIPIERTETKTRYANTLQNMGLLIESNGDLILTTTGDTWLKYTAVNSLSPSDILDAENVSHAIELERLTLRNLLSIIKDDAQAGTKPYNFGVELFYKLQEFFDAIEYLDFDMFINNLELVYFCQLINSSTFEIKRFCRLSEVERTEMYALWQKLANDKQNFPNTEPQDPLKKMAYLYTRARVKNSVQLDVRLRCRNIFIAYKELKEDNLLPIISKEYDVMNTSVASPNQSILPELEKRVNLPIEHQLIVSGCPGSGKSRFLNDLLADADENIQLKRITAHPDYSYSDLVGCYKPVPVYQRMEGIYRESGVEFEKGIPKINYEFVKGPLIEQYILAKLNPTYNFVLLIEEVNRTNCNILFGEFFQLLDRKNGKSEYPVYAMPDLAPLLENHGLNREIILPENLYICGTMNSADQGVFQLDSAFRRRWEFQYKGYSEPCMYDADDKNLMYSGVKVDWDVLREAINNILKGLSIHEDKLIGPYFLTVNELKDSEKVCNKLFLYLWDDVLRFQRSELMDFESFSDLKKVWDNGSGSPLKIKI